MKRTILTVAKNQIITSLIIFLLLILPNSGYAFFSPGTSVESFSGIIYKLAPALLLGYIIVIILLKKLKRPGLSDRKTGSYINLSELKKKGLLTPEEAKSIGESIRRQMEKNQELAARRSSKFANAEQMLLYDPEILALQEKAAAKPSVSASTNLEDTSSIKEPSTSPPSSAQLEKIQLPPDILNLWETGILSDQEVRDIRLRIWKKENP